MFLVSLALRVEGIFIFDKNLTGLCFCFVALLVAPYLLSEVPLCLYGLLVIILEVSI